MTWLSNFLHGLIVTMSELSGRAIAVTIVLLLSLHFGLGEAKAPPKSCPMTPGEFQHPLLSS